MNRTVGPRTETRRVLFEGTELTGTVLENRSLRLNNGKLVSQNETVLLPPCTPTKIICVHLNYRSRFFESRGKTDGFNEPTYFMKPTTTLSPHGTTVFRPEGYRYLNYEAEIAVVIGRPTRNIRLEDAWDCIAGYSCAFDLGLHDMRDTDAGSMLRVKGHDGFCPLGPGLVSGIDISKQALRTWRNGKLVQEAILAEELIFGFDYLVADLARHITLLPGDVILTGTPANSRPLDVGDVVETEVTNVGRLKVHIASGPAPIANVGHQPTDTDEVRRVALGRDDRLPPALKPMQI